MCDNNQVEVVPTQTEPLQIQENEPKKKNILKSLFISLFAIVIAVTFMIVIFSLGSDYSQTAARTEFISSMQTLVSGFCEGVEIEESGDILTFRLWQSGVDLHSTALLIIAGEWDTLQSLEDSILNMCCTVQDMANEKNTGYIIRVELVSASNHDATLCIAQNGKILQKLGI